MSNMSQPYDDEIDLLSLIETVWDGKWKIALTITISLLLTFGLNIINPNTTFTASTKIKPITSFDFDRYKSFNSSLRLIKREDHKLNIFEITQKSLLNLYIEEIEEGSLLEIATDKYNLINKEDFDSERDYKEAVEKFVSEIEILKPIKEQNETRLYHVLKAEYNDEDKWRQLLTFVNNEVNRKVKANIINRFTTIVSILNQKRIFAIEDFEIEIENIKKDYDRNTKDRLAFLAEQAAIARKLDMQKNAFASQRFNTQNTFVTNVNTDTPFYLRGYIAIEEEIRQITSRKDKYAFNKDLFRVEKQKRNLGQDKTLQRAKDLFNKTPINQTNFISTIVKVSTTDFEINNKRNLYYALAIVLGGIIGIVYVLITNAFRKRKIIQ